MPAWAWNTIRNGGDPWSSPTFGADQDGIWQMGADQAQFQTATNNAKAGCPVSKVLNATITMEATLE